MKRNLQMRWSRRPVLRTDGPRISRQNRLAYWAVISMTALTAGQSGSAQNTNAPSPATGTNATARMDEVVVKGRAEDLIGVADSATQGTVAQAELERRPILRPGEVLETVPGVIITQHAGGGKANQYFLRGFNLDHGTDFATTVDGVPINLGTHAHGQGYTDINWVIPELAQGVSYRKGPYYAEVGDFGTVGAADIRYFSKPDQSLLKLEGGAYGYARVLWATSPKVGAGLVAGGWARTDRIAVVDARGQVRVMLNGMKSSVPQQVLDTLGKLRSEHARE